MPHRGESFCAGGTAGGNNPPHACGAWNFHLDRGVAWATLAPPHRKRLLQHRANSSGGEHLPYKQGVGGSKPPSPTIEPAERNGPDGNPSGPSCFAGWLRGTAEKIRLLPFSTLHTDSTGNPQRNLTCSQNSRWANLSFLIPDFSPQRSPRSQSQTVLPSSRLGKKAFRL